ncbi:MAG: hypothetical protein HBSAPP03_05700 [Phycisphaerae bacterium]|nr:MAG: hypothetical protein HBSAPP03_05700 [Phycisphaerae bacterium]
MNTRTAISVMLVLAVVGLAPAQPHEAPTAIQRAPETVRSTGVIGRLIERAAPGDTIIVPPGVYREHLRLDKPLTLEGGGKAVIDGDGHGDIVEISAPDVTFRGFIVRNTGDNLDKENAAIRALAPRATIEHNTLTDILFGIDLREAPDSVIRGNVIGGKPLDPARRGDGLRLWRSDRALVEGNTLHDGRDAILWYSKGVVARGNTSRRCRYGLHLMFSDDVLIEGNTLEGNSVGVYLMYSTGVEVRGNRLLANRGPSGYGVGLKETDRFTLRDNYIAGNRVGIYLDGSPFTQAQPGRVTLNTLAFNDVGMTFLPSAKGNLVTENNFIDNLNQVFVAGRGNLDANRFWEGDRGNFWTDYSGYDQDRDGIGDFVHDSTTLFDGLLDREPKLRLFLFSPAQQAVEFVGRALPTMRPEPKFVDEVPLMRPVAVTLPPAPRTASRVMLIAGAGVLVGVFLSVLAAARLPACVFEIGGRS